MNDATAASAHYADALNSPLLTTAQAAILLNRPEGTLRYWRAIGYGPSYAKLGRGVVYSKRDLQSFLEDNRIIPSVRTEARKEASIVTR